MLARPCVGGRNVTETTCFPWSRPAAGQRGQPDEQRHGDNVSCDLRNPFHSDALSSNCAFASIARPSNPATACNSAANRGAAPASTIR